MPLVCPMPAPEDGMVLNLLGSVDCKVRGLTEAGYSALAQTNSPMSTILTVLLTLYIAFIGYRLLIGRAALNAGDLTVSALKLGAVMALATSWPTYQHLVFDTLFIGPEQLAAHMLGSLQPSDALLPRDPFAGLQAAYDELQRSSAFFSQRGLSTASPLQGGSAGAALALNAASTLMLLTSLGAVLASKIVLGLLLGLGPVFVVLLLFDATRGVFEGWLRACVAFALAPLMAILSLVVELILVEPDLVRLMQMRAQGVVDLAPANAVFLLVLISTGVSLALGIAVGVIAFSLRLPSQRSAAAAASAPDKAASPQPRSPDEAWAEPRAAALAAAVTAIERRESRVVHSERGRVTGMSSVSETRRAQDGPVVGAMSFTPIGQAHRRTAQPSRAASTQRRNR